MEELQVPTRRVNAEVFTSGGVRFAGGLFIAESPYHSGCFGDVAAVLNDERGFLPFVCDDPGVGRFLVNKDHLFHLRVEAAEHGDTPPAEETIDAGASGTLVLADGSRVTGKVSVETPISSSRLLDKLNMAGRFFPVLTDDGVHFVQRAHVVRAF